MSQQPNKKHPLFSFTHEAMATHNRVTISHHDERYARQAAQAVFAEIDRIENLLSCFTPGSDIWQLNHAHPGQTVMLAPETYECLKLAESFRIMTNGAFDENIGNLLPPAMPLSPAPPATDGPCPALHLPDDTLEVAIPAHGLNINLGAIGKGFALDKAAEILEEWELPHAILNSGGSTILALDPPRHRAGWLITCGSQEFELNQGSISGSGMAEKPGHIINPRTGQAADSRRHAWALAPTAAAADALSTASMVMTDPEINAFLKDYPIFKIITINTK